MVLMRVAPPYEAHLRSQNVCTVTLTFNYTPPNRNTCQFDLVVLVFSTFRNADVFVPKIWMGFYESAHHLDALWIVQNAALDAVGCEQIFGSLECLAFTHDHLRHF